MILTLLLATTTFAALNHANIGKTRDFVERTKPLEVVNGWTQAGIPDDVEREFIVALQPRNQQKLNNILMAVSDPMSDKYGKHLSLNELSQLIGCEQSVLDGVRKWVESSGARVASIAATRDMVTVAATPQVAAVWLETEFHTFKHANADKPLVRALLPYSAPIDLVQHIAFISNVHGLPAVSKRSRISTTKLVDRAAAAVGSDPLIGPIQLRQRYNVTTMGRNPKNSMAVAEFQAQYYDPADLKSFFAQYVPYSKNNTVAGVRPPGSNDPSQPGVEAALDIEYIMGVAPNIATYFYASADYDFWSGLTSWASLLTNDPNPPLVHSISYGDQTSASKPTKAYHDRLDLEFQKLGVRGISIIFASGDSGAGCDYCIWADPSFPATSPHVTSVGATRFIGGIVNGPEEAVNEFGSGGGFSWDFDAPSYQTAAVASFLKNSAGNLPLWFQYNPKGRATPDVAALGIGFAVVVSGSTESVGGTSASSPTFAAIVALLNDIRLNNNKQPLGFLNPWIYQTYAQHPGAFFDVTQGTNSDACCYTGFECTVGYDAVTGVGTPNFKILQTLI